MEVIDRYGDQKAFIRNTRQLIECGADRRSGTIESLEARVDQLNDVLAALIDAMGIPDETILKITNNEGQYEVVKQ